MERGMQALSEIENVVTSDKSYDTILVVLQVVLVVSLLCVTGFLMYFTKLCLDAIEQDEITGSETGGAVRMIGPFMILLGVSLTRISYAQEYVHILGVLLVLLGYATFGMHFSGTYHILIFSAAGLAALVASGDLINFKLRAAACIGFIGMMFTTTLQVGTGSTRIRGGDLFDGFWLLLLLTLLPILILYVDHAEDNLKEDPRGRGYLQGGAFAKLINFCRAIPRTTTVAFLCIAIGAIARATIRFGSFMGYTVALSFYVLYLGLSSYLDYRDGLSNLRVRVLPRFM